jgi:hypothetical protein
VHPDRKLAGRRPVDKEAGISAEPIFLVLSRKTAGSDIKTQAYSCFKMGGYLKCLKGSNEIHV